MASSSQSTHGIADPVELCLHRFSSVLDMHRVPMGEPGALPLFLEKLRTDRYFAMDFWALVQTAPRKGRMAISRQKMLETVVRCVGGPALAAEDPEATRIIGELDRMARREAPEEDGGSGEQRAGESAAQGQMEPRPEGLAGMPGVKEDGGVEPAGALGGRAEPGDRAGVVAGGAGISDVQTAAAGRVTGDPRERDEAVDSTPGLASKAAGGAVGDVVSGRVGSPSRNPGLASGSTSGSTPGSQPGAAPVASMAAHRLSNVAAGTGNSVAAGIPGGRVNGPSEAGVKSPGGAGGESRRRASVAATAPVVRSEGEHGPYGVGPGEGAPRVGAAEGGSPAAGSGTAGSRSAESAVRRTARARANAQATRLRAGEVGWESKASKVLTGVRQGVLPEEVGTGRTMALIGAALVLLVAGSAILLRQVGEEPRPVTVMPSSVNYVDRPATDGVVPRRSTVNTQGAGPEQVATQGSDLSGSIDGSGSERAGQGVTQGAAAGVSQGTGSSATQSAGPASGRSGQQVGQGAGVSASSAGSGSGSVGTHRHRVDPASEEEVVEVSTGPAKPSASGAPVVPAGPVPGVASPGATPSAADTRNTGTDTGGELRRVTVSSGVMAANLISSEPPKYPKMAVLAHMQGAVVLQAVISKAGDVESVRVIKGHYMLRGAAENAVRGWKYRPYLLNGKPVEVATIVTVNFELKK